VRRESIELLLDWVAALRDDEERAATALAADVEWRDEQAQLVCRGPDEVVRRFRSSRGDLDEVEAIELISRDSSAVLAAHGPDGHEIYDVFRFDDGRIVKIEDYARREDALAAAGSAR
jgi:hypothetical protein